MPAQVQGNQTQKAQPITRQSQPGKLEVPAKMEFIMDFTGGSTLNFSVNNQDAGFSDVRSMLVDNSNSPASTTVQIVGSNAKFTCPPYSQGIFPVFGTRANLQIQASSAGLVQVPITFLNIDEEVMIWAVTTPGGVQGSVNVTGTVNVSPTLGAYTKRNGTITAGGVSQQLAAANGARKRLFIQNPASATEDLYIQFTSAAGVDDGISIDLVPGASFDTGIGPCTSELVNVVATTAGHKFIAFEM